MVTPEHKPHPGPEFTWEDIETDSKMVFHDLDEMSSFLNWRSGRLEEQYEGCITRESGLALIEDAKRWEKAYREARDELAGTKEQLEVAHQALRIALDYQDVISGPDIDRIAAALGSNPAMSPGDAAYFAGNERASNQESKP